MAFTKPASTYPFTLTTACVFYDGGAEPKAMQAQKGENLQLWYSRIVAVPPSGKSFEAVTDDECLAAIIFWEPNVDRRPVEGSCAFVIGDAAFVPMKLDTSQESEGCRAMVKVKSHQVMV